MQVASLPPHGHAPSPAVDIPPATALPTDPPRADVAAAADTRAAIHANDGAHAAAGAHAERLVQAHARLLARGHAIPARAQDDAVLVAALARASGLYPAGVQASDLDDTHRRALLQELALALTREIPWSTELRHASGNAPALHVDHGVVRNAADRDIAAVRDAVDDRIGRALAEHRVPATDRGWMTPYLRDALVADPTLSLQPPPSDIPYGGRRWATLWMGMQAARDIGLAATSLAAADLVALGRVAMADPNGTLRVQALIRMAQAAGALDLAQLPGENGEHLASRLRAFALEHFAAELPLLEELGGVSRQALASRLLEDAGIHPDRQIRVESLVIPAAWGPFRLEIPLLFASYRTSALDYYMDRDTLSATDIDRLERGATAPRVDAGQALARLPASLADAFDARFDAYKKASSIYLAGRFDAWLSTLPAPHGAPASAARIEIATARLRRHALRPPPFRTMVNMAEGPPSRTGALLSDAGSHAYAVTVESGDTRTRYLFDPVTRHAQALPGDADLQEWILAHRDRLFPGDDDDTVPTADVLAIEPLAEGPRAALPAWLPAAIAERIEATRADAAGTTASESLRDFERGLLPFRSAYLAIRAGDVRGAIVAGLLDVATFLPGIGQTLKAGMSASRAVGAAVEAGLDGLRRTGLHEGLALASRQARGYGARLARWARGPAAALPHGAPLRQAAWTSPASMAGRLDAIDATALATELRDLHPTLAADVERAALRLHGGDVESGRWRVPETPPASAPPQHPTTQEITPEPAYIAARDAHGAELALQRHGERAYVRYNSETLEPVGPLLIADADRVLHVSLPVDSVARHRVTVRATLDDLARAAMREDGTFALGERRFARIADDYVEVVPDRAASTVDRPVWKMVEVPGPPAPGAPPRLAYDARLALWRPAKTPALKGGGNAVSAIRDMQATREARRQTGVMTRQVQDIARTLSGARYDRSAVNVWRYPEAVREHVPELVARGPADQFVRGPDGRIRRFPGNFVAHGTVIPGYARMIDPVLLERTGMMSDYAQLRGAQIQAGYTLDTTARTMSFRIGDRNVPSLLSWCGVYPVEDGGYLVAALNMAGEAAACEEMLVAQGKVPVEVVEQLRDYVAGNELDPKGATERLVRSLSRRLCAMPRRLTLQGMTHDAAIDALKDALARHGPCILNRNGRMVMLDAIEHDGKIAWLVIRDPNTCSRVRIPERAEFWEGADDVRVYRRAGATWTMPQVDAIFLPRESRIYERARNLSGNLADAFRGNNDRLAVLRAEHDRAALPLSASGPTTA